MYTNFENQQALITKGDCWETGVAESFFKTLKYEWL